MWAQAVPVDERLAATISRCHVAPETLDQLLADRSAGRAGHLGERRSDPFSSGVSQITSHRLPAVIDRWRHVDIDRTCMITGPVR